MFQCLCYIFPDFHRDFPDLALLVRSGLTSPGTRRLVDSPVLHPVGALVDLGVLRNGKSIWGNKGKIPNYIYNYIYIYSNSMFFFWRVYLRKSLNYWVIVSSHGTDDQVWGDLVCFVFFVVFFRGEMMFNLHLSCFGCEWPYYARYASFLDLFNIFVRDFACLLSMVAMIFLVKCHCWWNPLAISPFTIQTWNLC